jgi:hypothetical protein
MNPIAGGVLSFADGVANEDRYATVVLGSSGNPVTSRLPFICIDPL